MPNKPANDALDIAQRKPGLCRDLLTYRRNRYLAIGAINELRIKNGLEFFYRIAECGLRYKGSLGRTTEMPLLDKCNEIPQLLGAG